MERLQVLVRPGPAGPLIAGLRAGVRGCRMAKAELSAEILGSDGRGLDPAAALLVLSPGGFPEPGALARFKDRAMRSAAPMRWMSGDAEAGIFYPEARSFLEGEAPRGEHRTQGDWLAMPDESAAAAAERALFARLPQESDGYLARLDRRLSMAVSRVLIRTPLTPNAITTVSLALGLYGSWLLAFGDYARQILGAFALWSCCILDGCDGEVARLKLLCSKAGGLYDVIADNIVHVAIFAAIPIQIQRNSPGVSMLWPGLLLVSGVLACIFSVWYVVLRRPKEERGKAGLVVERLASRDFIYLVLVLTVVRRLEWFVWAAGIGSHAFNLALWALYLRTSRGGRGHSA